MCVCDIPRNLIILLPENKQKGIYRMPHESSQRDSVELPLKSDRQEYNFNSILILNYTFVKQLSPRLPENISCLIENLWKLKRCSTKESNEIWKRY